jgi:hypothetical protein
MMLLAKTKDLKEFEMVGRTLRADLKYGRGRQLETKRTSTALHLKLKVFPVEKTQRKKEHIASGIPWTGKTARPRAASS